MDIHFTCPHCNQTLVVDSTGAGETIPCPSCYEAILIPVDYIAKDKTPDTKSTANNLDKVRDSARLLVEDHWRNFLTLVRIDERQGLKAVYSFEATINMMTENMPEPDASVFRHIIETEREKLLDEYNRNPDALKARLGLTNRMSASTRPHNRQSLEELAVRTVVRATVWDSIWSIFRLFR